MSVYDLFVLTCALPVGLNSLQSFATDWKQALKDKNEQRRKKLQKERAVLIKDDVLTPQLTETLKMIFSWYADEPEQAFHLENPLLTVVKASRLWYRCGMKLSLLDTLLEEREDSDKNIYFKDFVDILERVIKDEGNQEEEEDVNSIASPSFEVRSISHFVLLLR